MTFGVDRPQLTQAGEAYNRFTTSLNEMDVRTDTKTDANKPVRVGEKTNKVWQNQTTGFYIEVVGAMLQMGFSEKEMGKIGSGNFLRLFDAATQAKK